MLEYVGRGKSLMDMGLAQTRTPLSTRTHYFMGRWVGDPFGPRCNKGDIMGFGVLFPKDFECRSDSEEEGELMARIVEDHLQVKRETGKSSRN